MMAGWADSRKEKGDASVSGGVVVSSKQQREKDLCKYKLRVVTWFALRLRQRAESRLRDGGDRGASGWNSGSGATAGPSLPNRCGHTWVEVGGVLTKSLTNSKWIWPTPTEHQRPSRSPEGSRHHLASWPQGLGSRPFSALLSH